MPRTPEQNQKIREETRNKILDSALKQYVRYGYNGTDMDRVASNAGVAKGLLYYYFKTKNILFRELFDRTMKKISKKNERFFEGTNGLPPIKKLVMYSFDIFGLGLSDPDYVRFAMRLPFDAFAVFGPDDWAEGVKGSREHTDNLEKIIAEGIKTGDFGCSDAKFASHAFWTVFVSGLFSFVKMLGETDSPDPLNNIESLKSLLEFGMNGIRTDKNQWEKALLEITEEKGNESI